MSCKERTRGVIVRVLDLSALEAQVLKEQKLEKPDTYAVTVNGRPWAIAEHIEPITGSKALFAFDCDGEGPDEGVTEQYPLEVYFYASYRIRTDAGLLLPNRHAFDLLPFASAVLRPKDLLDLPAEDMDLADFMHRFGDKLEHNFWLWHKILGEGASSKALRIR